MSSKTTFPLLPIRDIVVFPYTSTTFKVGRDFSIKAVKEALKSKKKEIILITQKNLEMEFPEAKEMFDVGTICSVIQVFEGPGDTFRVFVEGARRVNVEGIKLNSKGFFEVSTKAFKSKPTKKADVEKERKLFEKVFTKYFEDFETPPGMVSGTLTIKNNSKFIDTAASLIVASNPLDLQLVLESRDIRERFSLMTSILKMEIELRNLEADIESTVREKLEKGQKEFFINEHINALKNELQKNSDQGDFESDSLKEEIELLDAPDFVKEKLREEFKKYEMISYMSPESSVIRSYIETVIALPWNTKTSETINLKKASEILEKEHFGLEEVKKRVLEYLAVLKLNGDIKSPIICLAGPPGVGKTSIAASLAKATGRKFIRQSLGGIRDEAEIRGHRRTYVASMPGKIMQSIKKVKTKNPLFLLDEIDKLGNDYKGDPSSALLEVLDPEQNETFVDNYLDVEFDLSSVLFVATANDVSMIPPALKDRMEIIEIDGYTWYEKKNIALMFLVEKQKKLNGIANIKLEFTPDGLNSLIDNYTSEAGVRELERKIASICRKIAFKKAKSAKESLKKVTITEKNINDYLGVEKYNDEKVANKKEVGVVNGLAWTPYGGSILKIEAVRYPGKGTIKITGHLGDIMRESVEIAVSYIRSLSDRLFKVDKDFWENSTIHLHFPEGATPKDGPSAGIAIALAVASMASNIPVCSSIAMTGELTLRGRVLKIGGMKAKIMAAKKAGIKKVFIPAENKGEWDTLPEEIKEGIEITPITSCDKVIADALESFKKLKQSQAVTSENIWQ
ncbi:MAG: endopeptidase La [bacterium]